MMQEHPFFSKPQIYFGKPEGDDEEEMIDDLWGLSLSAIKPKSSHEKIGLIFFWTEEPPADESAYMQE
ncbi:MAG: hypothetical protein K1X28_07245 [Parachlamydiales bacterium]|nr:hypothetical protein [Parachlamydiales bacterium]